MNEMENEQYEEAAKHFDMVVIENGNDDDAFFFRAYCKCHVGKLGDIPNQTVQFTNAFCKYVDSLNNIFDEEEKKTKLKVAVEKYSELTSYYSANAKRTMFSAPSVGYSINSATKTMTDACNNKIRSCGINISNDVLEKVNTTTKENNNSKRALFILIGIGVAIFVIYEIITWIQISSI